MGVMETCFSVLVLFACLLASVDSTCREEYSGKAQWHRIQDSTVAISEPSCLDLAGKHIIRECGNGKWRPETAPACSKLHTNKICPRNYIETGDLCLKITALRKFDDLCPFPGIRYYNYTFLNSSLDFWMPIKRAESSYVYTSIDRRYGREFKFHDGNISSGCFSRSEEEITPSECSAVHHHVCAYRPEILLDSTKKTREDSNVSLILKFDKNREKLVLQIYGVRKLANTTDSGEHAVYCFTDASRNEMKVSVKKKLIYSCGHRKKCDHLFYAIPLKFTHAGQYWCEAYDTREKLIRSKTIVAYKKKKGNEYSLRLILENICEEDCALITPELIYDYLKTVGFYEILDWIKVVVRVMKVAETEEHKLDVIFHISTLDNNNMNVISEFYRIRRNILEKLPENLNFVSFRSSEFCLPNNSNGLHWKLTPIGSKITSEPLCLGTNGLPVMRSCVGDFTQGAFWGEQNPCEKNVKLAAQTRELLKISTSEIDAKDVESLKNLTSNPEVLTPLDLYLVANTFKVFNVSNPEDLALEDVVDTVENILEGSHEIFEESQIYLNATDTLLDSIDKILNDDSLLEGINSEIFFLRRNNVIIQISKPFLSNITGIAVYPEEVNHMALGETFDDLIYDSLDISVYVPQNLLESLIDEDDSDARDNLTIIITIFNNDKLFISNDSSTSGRVVSVSIPNFGIYLKEPIPLLFKNLQTENRAECAFWEYGTHAPNKTGHWSNKGGSNLGTKNETYSECGFTHLTHFALLILSQRMIVDEGDNHVTDLEEVYESKVHHLYLNIITLVGCSLSLIGIAGIFITGICFKRWRQKVGSKILIQLSITICLEMIVIHIAGSDFLPNYTLGCNVVGICLHYVVLSKFSWMFVSAILQYIRFVKVLTVLPPRLILKTMLFGWCAPLVPVITVALFWPSNYSLGSQNFCYPTGTGLYVGLFLPVVLIVGANLIVFTLIMRNILENKFQNNGRAKKTQKLQIYLGVLLFFMLGVPWIFGILAEILDNPIFKIIFIYLFCLTATLQGSVLFLFYVLLNRDTRKLWACVFKEDKSIEYK